MKKVLAVIAGLMLLSCSTINNIVELPLEKEYEFVIWTKPQFITSAFTHYSPLVQFDEYNVYADNENVRPLDFYKEMGVMPLLWRGGRNSVSGFASPEMLADYWAQYAYKKEVGIAIDELGGPYGDVKEYSRKALSILKNDYPDLQVYIWHAGLLDDEWIDIYKNSSAKIMLEIYTSDTSFMGFTIGYRLEQAKNAGLLENTIIGLGIQHTKNPKLWSYNIEILKKQMEWAIENYPEVAGFAFFASHADETVLGPLNEFIADNF